MAYAEFHKIWLLKMHCLCLSQAPNLPKLLYDRRLEEIKLVVVNKVHPLAQTWKYTHIGFFPLVMTSNSIGVLES